MRDGRGAFVRLFAKVFSGSQTPDANDTLSEQRQAGAILNRRAGFWRVIALSSSGVVGTSLEQRQELGAGGANQLGDVRAGDLRDGMGLDRAR